MTTPNNILAFPVPAATPAAPVAKSANDWITPESLRADLKAAGWNARRVSVKQGYGHQYIDVTVRDATVDINALKAFTKKHSTWSMDQTDYVSGQSITVRTTEEVDAAHALPRHGFEAGGKHPCHQPGNRLWR
jgi:hypothetical protein